LKHSDAYIDIKHSGARGSSHLYRQSWLPDGELRAGIILVHGLGEHSGRYGHLARRCTDRGFGVFTLDHYGHGKSDGFPGYVERFSVYLDGVRALLDDVFSAHAGLPLFLLGHSMGGLIAAALLPERQSAFRAAVSSGPLFRSDSEPPAIVMWIIRLLAGLTPTVPMIRLDPAGVSRDPKVVRAYVSDPLVHHGKLTARLINEMRKAMTVTLARARDVRLPILILHGEADVLTSPGGSRDYFDHLASVDKTLKIYPGLYHEIFNEPEKDDVIKDVTNWLEAHLT